MNNILSLFGEKSSIKLNNGKVVETIDLHSFCNSTKEYRLFMSNSSGIYAWYDENNGKIYVGSAKNLWKRFRFYKGAIFNRSSIERINVKLKNRIKKYGQNGLFFFVLEIFNENSEEGLRLLEQKYLDDLEPFGSNGYNIAKKTINYYPGIQSHKPLSCESMQKIKDANTGENSSNAILSNEKVLKIKKSLCEGEKIKKLAEIYNVSTTVISNIKRGLTWSHIKLTEKEELKLKSINKSHARKYFPKELVLNIKADIKDGQKMTDIAKKYNVGYTAVTGLKYNMFYKNIN